jgi:hypothetical protein
VDRVEQFVRRENIPLSSKDAENLREEIFAIADQWRERIARSRRERGDGNWMGRLEGQRGALIILSLLLGDDDRRHQTRERLINRLSPAAQAHLDSLDRGGRRQLQQWIRDSLDLKAGPDELEAFFADDERIDNKQREWLLSLPAEEMQTHLERMYYGAQLGVRDSERGWSDFRDQAGPPGQRRPGMRPDGPPPSLDRPGPPLDFPERGRFERGPNGPRRPRPGDSPDGPRRPNHPLGPPPNGASGPGKQEAI